MSFVCLSPVSHAGNRIPAGAVLPADCPTERLLRLGVIEERKPRPAAKTKKAGEE